MVTGGAGFIGGHVAEAFLKAGHEVVVVDNLSSGKRENVPASARFHHKDVRDPDIREIFAQERPDVLSHHAAQIDVRRSVADPAHDAGVNLLGLLNLMECGRAHGLRRVVFASSGGTVYGEQEAFPAGEEHPTRPICPYGVAKLASEHYLFFYRSAYGIPYVALRYANVYGPRQDPHGEAGVVAIFSERFLRGEEAVINGDGLQTRDYVFVGDVVNANLLALTTDYCGAINIGTGVETDVVTLFRGIRKHARSDAEEKHGPAKPGEQRRSVLNPARAQAVLGWQVTVPLDRGLAETVEFFRRRVGAS
jgi:UDP-glucose 4-epimerase